VLLSLEQNRDADRSPKTLASFPSFSAASVSTRASEAAGEATDRRSGVIAHLLADGRRSPEGERTFVEQSHCDALSRELEAGQP
jgi:hypothetical protein